MESYHKDEDGNFILDESGNKIPSTICLCYAHSTNECVCGAWDIPLDYHKTKVLPRRD